MRLLLILGAIGLALLPAPSRPPAAAAGSSGIDRAALDRARDVLAARRTKNLLVLRHGKIVYEWYAADSGPRTRHYTASMAKAIVGGMSLLLALQDGRLAIDDPASKYIPAWKDDPRKSRITLRHLATGAQKSRSLQQEGKRLGGSHE